MNAPATPPQQTLGFLLFKGAISACVLVLLAGACGFFARLIYLAFRWGWNLP